MQISFDTGSRKIKTNVLTLTPLGKQKVEALDGDGKEFMILSVLAERGPSTLQEIAVETGISKDQVKFAIRSSLGPKGYVSVMKTGGEQ